MIPVYRPHRQFLAAFGLLTALAVLDVGPRAAAAYLSAGDAAVSAGYGLDGTDDTNPADPPNANRERDGAPALTAHPGGIGGTASHGCGSAPCPVPVVGYLPPGRLPESELVVYFRESPASPWPFLLIDSLLDPPRRA